MSKLAGQDLEWCKVHGLWVKGGVYVLPQGEWFDEEGNVWTVETLQEILTGDEVPETITLKLKATPVSNKDDDNDLDWWIWLLIALGAIAITATVIGVVKKSRGRVEQ